MKIIPTPRSYRVSIATNRPAPLLKPGAGSFLVELKLGPQVHPLVDIPAICVHEGIWGHYFQSFQFQLDASKGKFSAPTRFLLVPDDHAWLRGLWIAMPAIEGWGLEAERIAVEDTDVYSPKEKIAAYTWLALRAARVIVDIGLHVDGMKPKEAEAFLESNALLTAEGARRQILRYCRIPTQAITYNCGMHQIKQLRRIWTQSKTRGGTFVHWLFKFGPVPPGLLLELLKDGSLEVRR